MGGGSRRRNGRGARAGAAGNARDALGVVPWREECHERAQTSQPDHRNRGRVPDGRSRNARSEIAHQRGDHSEGQNAAGESASSRKCTSRWSRSAPASAAIFRKPRREIHDIRGRCRLARANGLRLAAGGTHPFADWANQEIYPDERYHTIVEDMKMVARANLIFGLHVHIGVEDRETAIQIMNGARYFLPHILALSTNSPFWLGMDTGCARTAARSSTSFRAPTSRIILQLVGVRELRQPADPHQLHR
jgi:hypothetical protein